MSNQPEHHPENEPENEDPPPNLRSQKGEPSPLHPQQPEPDAVPFPTPSASEADNKEESNLSDIENLRLDQSYLDQPAAKRLLVTVPVRKPKPQDFVRVHPAPEYRICTALIELEADRECYIIPPKFLELFNEGEYYVATLYLAVTRQKIVFVWPVKLTAPGGRQNSWNTSSATGAEKAMSEWVRVIANHGLGAYEVWQSEKDFGEPQWPSETWPELLKVAFKGRIIDGPNHPVLQKLRGRI